MRDRFLGAAAGGYYLESSFLNGQGLQRGHFHTACRILASTSAGARLGERPGVLPRHAGQRRRRGAGHRDDQRARPATKTAGVLQCTSWAGDGSHRTPMMTKANETPAIDSVRIFVVGRGQRVDRPQRGPRRRPRCSDAAAAAADEAKQAQAEQQQAGAQKPDQDGAVAAAARGRRHGAADGAAAPAPAAAAEPGRRRPAVRPRPPTDDRRLT